MNHIHENPKGIDIAIQKLQTRLYNNINWPDVEMFGRVYKNKAKDGRIVPEAYLKEGEYVDVLTNDKKGVNIFFVEDNNHNTKEGILFKTELKIVFMVNLKKSFPDVLHRADMEAEMHALKLVKLQSSFAITGIEKGVETVLKEFDTDKLRTYDMQPWHVFAIVGDFSYQITC